MLSTLTFLCVIIEPAISLLPVTFDRTMHARIKNIRPIVIDLAKSNIKVKLSDHTIECPASLGCEEPAPDETDRVMPPWEATSQREHCHLHITFSALQTT